MPRSEFDDETLFRDSYAPPKFEGTVKPRRYTFQTSHPAHELLDQHAQLRQLRSAQLFEECFEIYCGIMVGRKDRRNAPQMAAYPSRVGEILRSMAHSTGLGLARACRLAAGLLAALETWEVGLDEAGQISYCSEPNQSGWSNSAWRQSSEFLGAIDWIHREAREEERGLAGFAVEMMLRGLDSYTREGGSAEPVEVEEEQEEAAEEEPPPPPRGKKATRKGAR